MRASSSRHSAAEGRRLTQELRALAHPLRLRLLEAFAQGERTTMQVAAELGEPATRLYHHVNALQRAGILALARTRQVRGTTEKYYRVERRSLGVPGTARMARRVRGQLRGVATLVLDEARADLLAAIGNPRRLRPETAPVAIRMLLTVPESRIPRVRKRILAAVQAIRKECAPKGSRAAARVHWALTLAFAPRTKWAGGE